MVHQNGTEAKATTAALDAYSSSEWMDPRATREQVANSVAVGYNAKTNDQNQVESRRKSRVRRWIVEDKCTLWNLSSPTLVTITFKLNYWPLSMAWRSRRRIIDKESIIHGWWRDGK